MTTEIDPAGPSREPDAWYALPVLAGRLVRLEPLAAEHAEGYLAAAGSGPDADEVFRWVMTPGSVSGAPRTAADARADVLAALAARARGIRFAYAQLDPRSGEVMGCTSYYDVDPALRTLAIGH